MITVKGPPARIAELSTQLDTEENLPNPATATVRYAEAFPEEGSKKSLLLLDSDETRAKNKMHSSCSCEKGDTRKKPAK